MSRAGRSHVSEFRGAARKRGVKSEISGGLVRGGKVRASLLLRWLSRYSERGAPLCDEREDSGGRDALIKLAVDSWRFGRAYEKAISKLPVSDRALFEGPLAAFGKKIEEALGAMDMKIAGIEGTPFDPGIAAIPLNIEDFGPDDELVVDRMMDPIIMGRSGIVRMGSVTLRKAGI